VATRIAPTPITARAATGRPGEGRGGVGAGVGRGLAGDTGVTVAVGVLTVGQGVGDRVGVVVSGVVAVLVRLPVGLGDRVRVGDAVGDRPGV